MCTVLLVAGSSAILDPDMATVELGIRTVLTAVLICSDSLNHLTDDMADWFMFVVREVNESLIVS